MFHLISVWFFRVVVVAVSLGLVYVAFVKPDTAPLTPVASQSTAAPPEADATLPCQPIGHTASGKLVYSMDCGNFLAPPQPAGDGK